MICKWCGANVRVSKGKCTACGKALPALSDCGGFYDVVPRQTGVPQNGIPMNQTGAPAAPVMRAATPQAHPPAPRKQDYRWLVVMIAVLLLAVLAVWSFVHGWVLSSKLSDAESEISRCRTEIEELREDLSDGSEKESGDDETTEPQTDESQMTEDPDQETEKGS